MPPEGTGELLVISRTYDLIKWSCLHIARFPRSFRCTLGDRRESRLYDILDALIQARYPRERVASLRAVNLHLEQLRFQFRLASDRRCLSQDSYGFAARTVNEIGQMVGGWIKGSLASRPTGRGEGPAA